MRILEEKETYDAGSFGYGAKCDIDIKAERAIEDHPNLFNHPQHLKDVAEVERLCKEYFAHFDVMYTTARLPAPRAKIPRPHCTQVKVEGYVLKHNRNRQKFYDDLENAGVKIVDPRNGKKLSYSFYIWP